MSPTDTKKCAKKLRGFTLIEMLVVIAIIAILAGMISLAMGGFQRDARMEATRNRAQSVYLGLQNVVSQCEIKQNAETFDNVALTGGTPNNIDKITYCTVCFTIQNAQLSNEVHVKTETNGGTNGNSDVTLASHANGYKKVSKAITDNISLTEDGTYIVYIDMANFTIDSVLYFEVPMDYSDAVSAATSFSDIGSSSTQGKTLSSLIDQRTKFDSGVYVGAYPFASAVSS
ncbi:MAG: type II secretion system GspH family protein [Oscillospiraceae bacterium]|nr:type II secretion system GspH family protein [Oscillospiraceae bacterium]